MEITPELAANNASAVGLWRVDRNEVYALTVAEDGLLVAAPALEGTSAEFNPFWVMLRGDKISDDPTDFALAALVRKSRSGQP